LRAAEGACSLPFSSAWVTMLAVLGGFLMFMS
jgi:hypothetical protein